MKNPVSILKTHACALLLSTTVLAWSSSDLHLTQHDVLETHGLTVLLFHNEYHRVFGDQKMNGMEIILHDQRIATSGDVRLSATPEQWDPIPDFKERKRGTAPDEVTAFCTYPDRGLSYRIDVQPEAGDFALRCNWTKPFRLHSLERLHSILSSCRRSISASLTRWTTAQGCSRVIPTDQWRRQRMELWNRCRWPRVIASFCRRRIHRPA